MSDNQYESGPRLWFDVEIERITTNQWRKSIVRQLWFDVEIERITTLAGLQRAPSGLWFDVEIERITTSNPRFFRAVGCGLM